MHRVWLYGIVRTKVRLKFIQTLAKIKVTNNSAVTLGVKHIRYLMEISKKGNLKGNYCEPINIKPNGTTFIEIPFKIDNIGKMIFDILINKDDYELKCVNR